MYAIAHRVVDASGMEGVNAFLHIHGREFAWPADASALPEINPGTRVTLPPELVPIRPGGNRVRSYLDLLALMVNRAP